MKISVIIIALNEEEMIGDCLKSVHDLAGEVIVIDGGSTDKTVEICQKAGADVYIDKFKDFSGQRNRGLTRAKYDWVLYVDADERVTSELKEEILKQINFPNQLYCAFDIPRKNIRLGGKELHFGGWWPDYVTRLFLRKNLHGWFGKVHESPDIDGQVGKLENPLIHFGRSLNQIINKTNDWSEVEARLLFEAKHPKVVWWRFLRVWLTEFCRRYFLLLGFRDGTPGIIEAMYQSFSRLVTYAKLWELQNKKP